MTSEVAPVSEWNKLTIRRIEDLADAVVGAGLEAVQMSSGPIMGSLAFMQVDGVACTAGYIEGQVMLKGPLSETGVTLGIGLSMPPGCRHWLKPVSDHDAGVFLPGDVHDSFYVPGSHFVSVTVSFERLETIAERMGLVLDPRTLGPTGHSSRAVAKRAIDALRPGFERLHADRSAPADVTGQLGFGVLGAAIEHFAREPRRSAFADRGHTRIVTKARAYIADNLDQPQCIDSIADAACTSHRTLYRAFADLLDETPQSYVRKLRLHRIRKDLVTDTRGIDSVTVAAHQWGIGELGRLAGWYRHQFGELPSKTLERRERAGRERSERERAARELAGTA